MLIRDGSNLLGKKDPGETTPVPLLPNQVHVVLGQCSSVLAPQRGRDAVELWEGLGCR